MESKSINTTLEAAASYLFWKKEQNIYFVANTESYSETEKNQK